MSEAKQITRQYVLEKIDAYLPDDEYKADRMRLAKALILLKPNQFIQIHVKLENKPEHVSLVVMYPAYVEDDRTWEAMSDHTIQAGGLFVVFFDKSLDTVLASGFVNDSPNTEGAVGPDWVHLKSVLEVPAVIPVLETELRPAPPPEVFPTVEYVKVAEVSTPETKDNNNKEQL